MKFIANGEHYEFDESRITFGEARALEEATGLSMGDMGKGAGATGIQAFIWLAVRRRDPKLKFSDLDDWNMADLEMEGAPEVEDADPSQGSDEPPA